MMAGLKNAASFLRWQIVPVRMAGKVAGSHAPASAPAARMAITDEIERHGHAEGPTMDRDIACSIARTFEQRAKSVVPRAGGHPFRNLLQADDLDAGGPILQHAFSPAILDIAHDYFGGRFILDSLQLLYSWPTDGLDASQYWHRDFGDSRSLHSITYITDVPDESAGAFTFVNKEHSKRIRRSPFIRRIVDEQFAHELAGGEIQRFFGQAGESVLVDPAACYHFGSRCKVPRLALFVTFNSDRPYVAADPLVRDNRAALLEAAKSIRPDLSHAYLARLLLA
jgi:hypothetical protein